MKTVKSSNLSDNELMKALKVDLKTLRRFKEIRAAAIEESRSLFRENNKQIKVLGVSGSARDTIDMAQEESNSEKLLQACIDECRRLGAKTEIIRLRDYKIGHCKACYSTVNTQCHFPCSCYPKGTLQGDDMTNILYDKVIGADVVVFATPVNNFSMSTMMKAFIDRCISLDGSLYPADPKMPKDKELNKKHMRFIELTADNDVPGSGFIRRFSGKIAGIIVTGHEEGASMVISSLFMTLNHFGMLFPPFSNMYAMTSVCNATDRDKQLLDNDCYRKEAKFVAGNVMKAAKLKKLAKLSVSDWKHDYASN